MRLIVFFDLPTTTKKDKINYGNFRNFLLKNGYTMLQFSVYMRLCNGMDMVNKHSKRLKNSLPPKGSVRTIIITEKQYERMDFLVGNLNYKEKVSNKEQISFF